jgi:hypothetical protein
VSAIAIGIDVLSGRRQKLAVMNLVCPITGLYFGRSRYRHIGGSVERSGTLAATAKNLFGKRRSLATVIVPPGAPSAISPESGSFS